MEHAGEEHLNGMKTRKGSWEAVFDVYKLTYVLFIYIFVKLIVENTVI